MRKPSLDNMDLHWLDNDIPFIFGDFTNHFQPWEPGEPNQATPGSCVQLTTSSGDWQDEDCADSSGAVCEKGWLAKHLDGQTLQQSTASATFQPHNTSRNTFLHRKKMVIIHRYCQNIKNYIVKVSCGVCVLSIVCVMDQVQFTHFLHSCVNSLQFDIDILD